MTWRVTFFVPGKPVAKGRPRFARAGRGVRAITPEATRRYEGTVAHAASLAMDGAAPVEGPVTLEVLVVVPVPTSWSQKRQRDALAQVTLPAKRPDLDNMCKSILDGCDGIVWRDDAQVVTLIAAKVYGSSPGVTVEASSI